MYAKNIYQRQIQKWNLGEKSGILIRENYREHENKSKMKRRIQQQDKIMHREVRKQEFLKDLITEKPIGIITGQNQKAKIIEC